MDIVSLSLIIDRLTKIMEMLYVEEIDGIEGSELIGKVIDELEGWKPYVDNPLKKPLE